MQEISIIGAGFSCIDIIKSDNTTSYHVGGTAANVISILSQLGAKATLLVPKYNDELSDLFHLKLQQHKIRTIEFKQSKLPTPRVIEHCNEGMHYFETKCSKCGAYLSKVALPSPSNIQKLGNHIWYNTNALFIDRISDGIKLGIQKARDSQAWVYYEPNSCRQFSTFYNNISKADIVKFSEEILPESYIDRIISTIDENSKIKLLIISQGNNGLKYSLKTSNGKFTEWVHLPPSQIDNIIDTSGAGDWLAASFLWYFLDKFPKAQDYLPQEIINQILIDSQIVAAHSCLYLGAHGIFCSSDGISFLRSYFKREIDPLSPISFSLSDKHSCNNCLSLQS